MKSIFWIAIGIISYIMPLNVMAKEKDVDDLLLSFGDEDFVSVATGQKKAIAKAPAIASVITSEDIKAIGATTVEEALEMVPGLHVIVDANGYLPKYTFRGIHTKFNPQVLFLINGIPVTNVYIGDRSLVWGRMPVEAIDRIEIIRGPGSAIYGADAFAGVINVITKTGNSEFDEVGIRSGSFNSNELWVSYTGQLGNWHTAFVLEHGNTDGHKSVIDNDLQSFFDGLFGTTASLAPGSVEVGFEYTDMRFDLSQNGWRFRSGYQGRNKIGPGAGTAQALDNYGRGKSERLNADLTYKNEELTENWEINAQVSWFDTTQEADLRLFPPGTILPIGADGNIGSAPFSGAVLFVDGVFGSPYVFETHKRINVDSFYKGFDRHTIRIGLGWSAVQLRAEERKNFGPGVIDGSEGIVDGTLTNVTGTPNIFIPDEERDISYLFIQDEWALASDWELTTGVRYDDYSDFGNTVNPRIALVWQAAYNMTAKLLYGQAFRAPSFQELFNINNPVAIGNPNLNPEEINTIEIALDYTSPSGKIRSSVNAYNYDMTDIIRFVPDLTLAANVAQNVGKQEGIGLEWEIKWDASESLNLNANYAWQKAEDKLTNSNVGIAPQQQFYLRADWSPNPKLLFNSQLNYIADRHREVGDLRAEIDDYVTVDFTARYQPGEGGSEFALSVRNAFDEDVREPSLAPGYIVNDLPLAGRSVFGEYRYSW